jgi:hypothetical protein
MKVKAPKKLTEMKAAPGPQPLTMPSGQAFQALQALQRMATMDEFPGALSYRIARVIARLQINPDLMAFDTARAAIVRKLSGGAPSLPADKLPEFMAEYDPLAMTPITLDLPRLPLAILDHAAKIKPADVMALEPFLEEEGESK